MFREVTMRRWSFAVVLCAVVALAGCGGGTARRHAVDVRSADDRWSVRLRDRRRFHHRADPAVADGAVNPSSTISGPSTSLSGAAGIARDPAGNIYVANGNVNGVLVFPPALAGNLTPMLQITGASTGLVVRAASRSTERAG